MALVPYVNPNQGGGYPSMPSRGRSRSDGVNRAGGDLAHLIELLTMIGLQKEEAEKDRELKRELAEKANEGLAETRASQAKVNEAQARLTEEQIQASKLNRERAKKQMEYEDKFSAFVFKNAEREDALSQAEYEDKLEERALRKTQLQQMAADNFLENTINLSRALDFDVAQGAFSELQNNLDAQKALMKHRRMEADEGVKEYTERLIDGDGMDSVADGILRMSGDGEGRIAKLVPPVVNGFAAARLGDAPLIPVPENFLLAIAEPSGQKLKENQRKIDALRQSGQFAPDAMKSEGIFGVNGDVIYSERLYATGTATSWEQLVRDAEADRRGNAFKKLQSKRDRLADLLESRLPPRKDGAGSAQSGPTVARNGLIYRNPAEAIAATRAGRSTASVVREKAARMRAAEYSTETSQYKEVGDEVYRQIDALRAMDPVDFGRTFAFGARNHRDKLGLQPPYRKEYGRDEDIIGAEAQARALAENAGLAFENSVGYLSFMRNANKALEFEDKANAGDTIALRAIQAYRAYSAKAPEVLEFARINRMDLDAWGSKEGRKLYRAWWASTPQAQNQLRFPEEKPGVETMQQPEGTYIPTGFKSQSVQRYLRNASELLGEPYGPLTAMTIQPDSPEIDMKDMLATDAYAHGEDVDAAIEQSRQERETRRRNILSTPESRTPIAGRMPRGVNRIDGDAGFPGLETPNEFKYRNIENIGNWAFREDVDDDDLSPAPLSLNQRQPEPQTTGIPQPSGVFPSMPTMDGLMQTKQTTPVASNRLQFSEN